MQQKACDTLDTGQLHLIADFFLLIFINFIFRCITCKKSFNHILQKSSANLPTLEIGTSYF